MVWQAALVQSWVYKCFLKFACTAARSSNGRTTVSGTVYWGSNPCRAAVHTNHLKNIYISTTLTRLSDGVTASLSQRLHLLPLIEVRVLVGQH